VCWKSSLDPRKSAHSHYVTPSIFLVFVLIAPAASPSGIQFTTNLSPKFCAVCLFRLPQCLFQVPWNFVHYKLQCIEFCSSISGFLDSGLNLTQFWSVFPQIFFDILNPDTCWFNFRHLQRRLDQNW
jgi:hypothetical protein